MPEEGLGNKPRVTVIEYGNNDSHNNDDVFLELPSAKAGTKEAGRTLGEQSFRVRRSMLQVPS